MPIRQLDLNIIISLYVGNPILILIKMNLTKDFNDYVSTVQNSYYSSQYKPRLEKYGTLCIFYLIRLFRQMHRGPCSTQGCGEPADKSDSAKQNFVCIQ